MAELALVADEGHMLIDEGKSLSDLISELEDVKDRYAAASAIEKGIKDEKTALEQLIIARLKDAKLGDASNGRYRASMQTEIVPSVKDWEKTYKYIADHGYFHLLYRQLNAGAFRELLDTGETLPGAESFEKEKLSFTKVAAKGKSVKK